MKDISTHQWQRVIERIASLSNEELLDEVLSQAQGDAWDGNFTERGLQEYEYHKAELEKRLGKWLKE